MLTSDLRKKQKEFTKCRDNAFYFLTHYVYSYDQADGNNKLFPEWDYVRDILEKISEPGDFFLEKSRDMMVSWTIMGFFLHRMLFRENWSGFAISRKQDEVDDGGANSTPESLFGRIKYMHKHLPPWLKPEFLFSQLKIINRETESYATGESANPNSGRNVACTFKFCDEFAFLPINDQVDINRSMRFGSYRTLLYVTTAKEGTLAEKISKQGMGFEKISCHWSIRPDRDQEWYKKKTAGSTPEDIAAELDISYSESVEAPILRQFWSEEEGLIEPLKLPAISSYAFIACGLDYGYVRTAVELAGMQNNIWYVFHEFYEQQVTTSEVADKVNSLSRRFPNFVLYMGKDRPDLVSELINRGIIVISRQQPVQMRLAALINVFKSKRIRISTEARGLLSEIPSYKRNKIRGVVQEKPHIHCIDEAIDALGYLLLGVGESTEDINWSSRRERLSSSPSVWSSSWNLFEDREPKFLHERLDSSKLDSLFLSLPTSISPNLESEEEESYIYVDRTVGKES